MKHFFPSVGFEPWTLGLRTPIYATELNLISEKNSGVLNKMGTHQKIPLFSHLDEVCGPIQSG